MKAAVGILAFAKPLRHHAKQQLHANNRFMSTRQNGVRY
jgi:hypothetical protein